MPPLPRGRKGACLVTKLSEVIADQLERTMEAGDFTVPDVVERIRKAAPDVVEEEGDKLLNAALARRVKGLLRDFEDDETVRQGHLFGLPRALAFETTEGIRYIDTERATWDHLRGALSIRSANVSNAEARLHTLEQTMASVESVMVANPGLTLGEAVTTLLAVSA